MITYEKACKIAKDTQLGAFPSYEYFEVVEADDRWAFALSVDADTVLTPAPMFFVFKKDGSVEWFSIPPIENLLVWQNGKKIKFID